MRSRSSTPLVWLATLALAGCGSAGSSPSAFRSSFLEQRTELRKLGADLATTIRQAAGKTDAQLAAQLVNLSARSAQQASRLAKLNPPSRYQGTLGELVSSFRAVGGDLHQIATAATRHDASAAKAELGSLLQDAKRVKAGDTTLSRALKLPGG